MKLKAHEKHSGKPEDCIPLVSLFAGAGAMDYGFRSEGFLPVIAIDINQAAVDSYNLNDRRGVAQRGDLAKLGDQEIVEVVRAACNGRSPRGVIGGPPCQGVSSSNVHSTHQDRRKRLLLRYATIVKALNAAFSLDFFVFENVVGLKSKKHKQYFRKITRVFQEAGFSVFEKELDAKDFGVAQRRRRVFVIGINRNTFPGVQFEIPVTCRTATTVRDVIGALPDPVFYRRRLSASDVPYHPNHWAMNPRSPKFKNGLKGSGRSFRVLDWDCASSTVAYGHREMHVHPNRTRRVSVYEGMLLQGFPPDYKLLGTLSEQVDQVSNAVPPPLARAIAESIRETIYERVRNIQINLLAWFKRNQRSFPWRQTRDPYRILLAEKLLQQTAATEGLVNAYNKLVKSFPTLKSLSDAPPTALRKIIGQLGFTYRADELPRLARKILVMHNGKIPTEIEDLLNLPGIGDYTARAIKSFAYDQDVPVVDTNIARFLHRVFALTEPLPANPARNKKLITLASMLIPRGKARDFNLAVLDLCSAVCTVRQPQCSRCPIQNECDTGRTVR